MQLKSVFYLLCIFLSSLLRAGEAVDLAHVTMKNLRTGEHQTLAEISQHPTLAMFFEPDCIWCVKQATVLQQLEQQCGGKLSIAGLGVNASAIALRHTLTSMTFPYPAFALPKATLAKLGGIPATPIMVLFEHDVMTKAFRGYTDLDHLKSAVSCTQQ